MPRPPPVTTRTPLIRSSPGRWRPVLERRVLLLEELGLRWRGLAAGDGVPVRESAESPDDLAVPTGVVHGAVVLRVVGQPLVELERPPLHRQVLAVLVGQIEEEPRYVVNAEVESALDGGGRGGERLAVRRVGARAAAEHG